MYFVHRRTDIYTHRGTDRLIPIYPQKTFVLRGYKDTHFAGYNEEEEMFKLNCPKRGRIYLNFYPQHVDENCVTSLVTNSSLNIDRVTTSEKQ